MNISLTCAVSSCAGQVAKSLAKSTKDATRALVYLRETRENNRLFIHPLGNFMNLWNGALFLGILYSATCLPIRFSFLEGYTLDSTDVHARPASIAFLVLDIRN